jgi:lipopolysaccharide transport system permease protein
MEQSTAESRPAGERDFDLWIEAGRAEKNYWSDLWRYRELLVILAWRDIAVRYKQTVAGAAWALLQPFISMLIMTLVFGRLAGLPSVGSAPYAIMVFAALLPWQFFANALTNASQSLVGNANMISKVYFPRVIVPTASVAVSLVDFVLSFAILAGLMAWYQFLPSWRLLTLPVFVLLAIFASLGPGLLITALTVRYRDFRFIVPFLVQFGMFASPVAFSTDIVRAKVGETWFLVYSLNPLVGVIEGFRWAILGGDAKFFTTGSLLSLLVAAIFFVVGLSYFRRTERSFADII